MPTPANLAIDLLFPLKTADGRTLSQLTLRRAKARDLRLCDRHEGDVAKTHALIPALCLENITPADVEELDGADAVRLGEAVGRLLMPNGPD